MRKAMKKLVSLGLSGLMVWSLTGCGNSKPAVSSTSETQAAAQTQESAAAKGNALNVHIDVEVASMDPQIATDGTSFEVIADTTDGLYELDADGNPVPALAESVDKSADGLTLTYHLRDAK